MTNDSAALARAAERLAGTPFRLHGRDPATGLDCIGVVGAALGAIGRPAELPIAYALRNSDIGEALRHATKSALVRVSGRVVTGDIVLTAPGPAQYHLLIALGGERFVHAHAGLRRVVVTPGPIDEPIVYHWRLPAQKQV